MRFRTRSTSRSVRSSIFDLESDFDLNTGSTVAGIGSALFGRQACVGLASPYGTVTLGRQYDFAWDFMTVGYFSPTAYALATGGHIGDVDRQGGDRLNNAVKFTSVKNPTFFDPYGQLGVSSFLGQATTADGEDAYPEGNFALDRQSSAEFGASYKFGALTAAGNITATTFKGYGQSQTLWIYEGGLIYSFTPQIQGIAAYEYERTNGVHWNQPTVGAYYFLSKRTSFYAAASYQIASGPVVAQQGQDFYWHTPSSNREPASVRLAIIHRI